MSLTAIVVLVLKIGVGLAVFAFGLKATFQDATFLFRRPERLLNAMVSMFVLMPLFAVIVASVLRTTRGRRFSTILADPPWQFQNKTGKVAPEHRRLSRYATLTLDDIRGLPVQRLASDVAHLYLWVPNALLPEGLSVMQAWGFQYKSNIVWHKVRKDGGSDGRGVGFYFRNVTEMVLFGVRGKNARTLQPGRRQVNYMSSRKREHSRKPDELYPIIEACSPGPYLELFARGARKGWTVRGNQADDGYRPTWNTYAHNSTSSEASERSRKQRAQLALALSG